MSNPRLAEKTTLSRFTSNQVLLRHLPQFIHVIESCNTVATDTHTK